MDSSVFDEFYLQHEGLSLGDIPSEELTEYLRDRNVTGYALDIGCGDGRDSLPLAEYGLFVTSLDISEVAIDKLNTFALSRGLGERISTIITDIRLWDYPSNYFDVVISATSLDHIPAEQIEGVVEKITGSIKRGGILFVEVHTTEDPGCDGEGPVSELASQIKHYFEPNELLRLFMPSFHILRYEDKLEWDYDHGEPHLHGFATLLARRK